MDFVQRARAAAAMRSAEAAAAETARDSDAADMYDLYDLRGEPGQSRADCELAPGASAQAARPPKEKTRKPRYPLHSDLPEWRRPRPAPACCSSASASSQRRGSFSWHTIVDAAADDDDRRLALETHIGYKPAGTCELTDAEEKVLREIHRLDLQPAGFEFDKRYGPMSGLSFEHRLVAAYSCGLLHAAAGTPFEEAAAVCAACGAVGHRRSSCTDFSGARHSQ